MIRIIAIVIRMEVRSAATAISLSSGPFGRRPSGRRERRGPLEASLAVVR